MIFWSFPRFRHRLFLLSRACFCGVFSGAGATRRGGGPSRHRRPPAGVRAARCLSRWSARLDERPERAAGGVLGLCLAGGDGMAPSLTPAPCGWRPRDGPGPSRSPRPRRRHPPARALRQDAGRAAAALDCHRVPPFPVVTGGACNHCVPASARYVTDCGELRRPMVNTGAASVRAPSGLRCPRRTGQGGCPVLAGRGREGWCQARSARIFPVLAVTAVTAGGPHGGLLLGPGARGQPGSLGSRSGLAVTAGGPHGGLLLGPGARGQPGSLGSRSGLAAGAAGQLGVDGVDVRTDGDLGG
jgi:hypothetical protein